MFEVVQAVEAMDTKPLYWQPTMYDWVSLIASLAVLAVGFSL